ncbi:10 kDa heat shock protein, mitochondrial-like [Pan troglodytes]|uniref:10 kDa heat shock protein, mitochondrial-like n=1 Tax=Pan troglodytes TaxID=9598 RepID=UPI003013D6B7
MATLMGHHYPDFAGCPTECLIFSTVVGYVYLRQCESRVLSVAAGALRKFLPLFDKVLVERSVTEAVTKGGIMLPEKISRKGMAVAVGSGSKAKGKEIQPVSVKVEDKVFPQYEGTKVVLDDKDYFLFRDGDILGKYVD